MLQRTSCRCHAGSSLALAALPSAEMAGSKALQARRALVKLLLALASVYSVRVRLSRDSTDPEVAAAFRKVVLKRGG